MIGSRTLWHVVACTAAIGWVGLLVPAAAEETASPRAGGTVLFDGKAVPIAELLDTCAKARQSAKPHLAKKEAAEARVAEINKAVGKILATHRTATAPLKREMSQAQAKKNAASRGLSVRKPIKPTKLRGGSSKGKGKSSHGNIGDINRKREQAYQQALNQYNQIHQQSQKAFREAEADVARLEMEIATLDAERDKQQKPLLVERTERTRELRDAQQQVRLVGLKTMRIAAAIGKAPEALRLRWGAVEWKNAYYSIGELKTLHQELEATIAADRKALQADLAKDGKSVPKTWRHTQQAEADALKARIAGAEIDVARASKL